MPDKPMTKQDGTRAPSQAAIIMGDGASDLEGWAGDQLCGYLEKLFGIQARRASVVPDDAEILFLIGDGKTNPGIDQAKLSRSAPALDNQAFLLRRMTFNDRPAMLITGGSPRATMWAVHELVEHWGVRYLLHGDVLPSNPPFELPDLDEVHHPALPVRQWRVVNLFACGPESWGMADYQPVLDQLAKLKFNRILIWLWPWQPFLHLEIKGIQRQSACLWFGEHYPITDDMVGRHLFGDEKEFWNPDLPRESTYEELVRAGIQHIQNLISYARQRGMESVVSAELVNFPNEFAPLLGTTDDRSFHRSNSVMPGPECDPNDTNVTDLATAVLQTTINTYSQAEFVAVGMPEHRYWADWYEQAWTALDRKYNLSSVRSLPDMLAAAERRVDYPGGPQRAVTEVKGDLVALYFIDRLLDDLEVLKDTVRPDMKILFCEVAEELLPLLAKLVPPGSETMDFFDYTSSRILRRRHVLERPPGGGLASSLIYTLHDDNVGVLPQLTTTSLYEVTKELYQHGWAGFSTRYWLIGDHEPCVAYLAKAGWHKDATPHDVYEDQVAMVCGTACVTDMLELFREVESTTEQLEWHGLGLTFPTPDMIMRHWKEGPMSEDLHRDREGYQRALDAARRALAKAKDSGQAYIEYWVGRLEFGIDYLNAIEQVRQAATAEAKEQTKQAIQHTESALTIMRRALEAYVRVAQDQSDRGAIALMNEHIYRRLKEKLEQLKPLGDSA